MTHQLKILDNQIMKYLNNFNILTLLHYIHVYTLDHDTN